MGENQKQKQKLYFLGYILGKLAFYKKMNIAIELIYQIYSAMNIYSGPNCLYYFR